MEISAQVMAVMMREGTAGRRTAGGVVVVPSSSSWSGRRWRAGSSAVPKPLFPIAVVDGSLVGVGEHFERRREILERLGAVRVLVGVI